MGRALAGGQNNKLFSVRTILMLLKAHAACAHSLSTGYMCPPPPHTHTSIPSRASAPLHLFLCIWLMPRQPLFGEKQSPALCCKCSSEMEISAAAFLCQRGIHFAFWKPLEGLADCSELWASAILSNKAAADTAGGALFDRRALKDQSCPSPAIPLGFLAPYSHHPGWQLLGAAKAQLLGPHSSPPRINPLKSLPDNTTSFPLAAPLGLALAQ